MTANEISDPRVANVFRSYPAAVRRRLLRLRQTILDVGSAIEGIGTVEETLKWGEPSYATIAGSAVRLGWKARDPDHIAVLFHCQTTLVGTFRVLYPDRFAYSGNRAIILPCEDPVPQEALRHCVELAFTYHRRKHLPLLGATAGGRDADPAGKH